MEITTIPGGEIYSGETRTRGKEKIELSNKTIAKLAIAIATAQDLVNNGEVIGPLTNKVLLMLDTLDTQVEHFIDYQPKTNG